MDRTIVFRIKFKSPGVFEIEERHRFMFFWTFWVKGSIFLKIPSTYGSPKLAEAAITKTAEEKGRKVFIMNFDGAKEAIKAAQKKVNKAKRKRQRKEEEKAQNLRRIGKEPEPKAEEKKKAKKAAVKKTATKPKTNKKG